MFRFDFNFFYMKITTFLVSLCFLFIGVSTNAFNKINETKLFSNVVTDPVMPSLQNLQNCGSSTFNLTDQTSIILAAQSGAASNYAVTYYLSQVNATTGTNPISNPSAYTCLNNQQVIYARVINNGTTQYAVGAFALMLNNPVTPIFNLGTTTICQGDTAPVLPTTSTNGITGTWSPSTIDTNYPGTYTYMFTPNSGQCTLSVTMAFSVLPSPSVSNLPTLMKVCDNDSQPNDLYTTFNIASYLGVVPDCTINYYLDNDHSQPILNPTAFVNTIAATQTIFLIITNNTSGCIKYRTLTLNLLPIPTPRINPPTIASCDANNDGFQTVDLTTNTSYIENGDPNVSLHYYYTLSDALVNTNEILNPTVANVNGNVWIRVENNFFINSNNEHCYTLVEQPVQINPTPSLVGIGYTIVNISGVQTLTIDVNGSGIYGYALDGGPSQTSNIFSNVSLGNHTITITNLISGCVTMIYNIDINLTSTPPPTGNTTQSFSQGATLANMQVTGQNIQWYLGVNKMASSSPLPLSTVLVNGTTYYASQKIGGYESATRLPVTAQVSLSNTQFELKGLTYAPNPVKTNLNIKCDEIIDEVSVYNLLGQLVNQTKVLNSELQVDLSSLKSGNYFVKVSSGSSSSTFKIIKE